jgi:hypothetical protein
MKEFDKNKYVNKINKEYKSISPHSIGSINEKNTKNIHEET